MVKRLSTRPDAASTPVRSVAPNRCRSAGARVQTRFESAATPYGPRKRPGGPCTAIPPVTLRRASSSWRTRAVDRSSTQNRPLVAAPATMSRPGWPRICRTCPTVRLDPVTATVLRSKTSTTPPSTGRRAIGGVGFTTETRPAMRPVRPSRRVIDVEPDDVVAAQTTPRAARVSVAASSAAAASGMVVRDRAPESCTRVSSAGPVTSQSAVPESAIGCADGLVRGVTFTGGMRTSRLRFASSRPSAPLPESNRSTAPGAPSTLPNPWTPRTPPDPPAGGTRTTRVPKIHTAAAGAGAPAATGAIDTPSSAVLSSRRWSRATPTPITTPITMYARSALGRVTLCNVGRGSVTRRNPRVYPTSSWPVVGEARTSCRTPNSSARPPPGTAGARHC